MRAKSLRNKVDKQHGLHAADLEIEVILQAPSKCATERIPRGLRKLDFHGMSSSSAAP